MSEAITHYKGLTDFNRESGVHILDITDSTVLDFYLKNPMKFDSEEKYKSFIDQIATGLGLTVEEDKKSIRMPHTLVSNGEKVVYFSIDRVRNKIELESFGINRNSKKAKEAADYLVKLFSS